MPTKRGIFEQMRRDELLQLLDAHELHVPDRRKKDDMLEASVRAKRVKTEEVFLGFPRSRLKGMCRALGLDDSGKVKADIAKRLVADLPLSETHNREQLKRCLDSAQTMSRLSLMIILAILLVGCGLPRATRIRTSDGRMADLLECSSEPQCLRLASKCSRGYEVLDSGGMGEKSLVQACPTTTFKGRL
jgi:hypothetical protein